MSVGNAMQVKRDSSIRQVIRWSKPAVFILICLLGVYQSFAGTRECLYTNKKPSVRLQEILNNIQNLDRQPVSYTDLIQKDAYYVRVVPLNAVLTPDNKIKRDAYLGGKPFVFLTIPESLYGVSLLNLLLDLGYNTEDIIASGLKGRRDNIKVVVVFHYPQKITAIRETDGRLPENWRDHVYIPTWKNIFALFNNLAREVVIEPEAKRKSNVSIIDFKSESERNRVLGLSSEAKDRIASTPYALLKAKAGEDWQYRQLLEAKLSVFEHFRGNGRTLNEVNEANGQRADEGIPEFVGPNQRITDLPEVAIIDLGRLILYDTFTPAQTQFLKQRGGQGLISSGNVSPPQPDHIVRNLVYGLIVFVVLVLTLLLARKLLKSRVSQTRKATGAEGRIMNDKEQRSWRTPEFLLVIVMLSVLALLVFFILIIPPLAFTGISGNNLKDPAKEFLEYRKTLLSIVVTAFGAWVGAGAAYYFGRENLAEASRSLLAMKEPSPQERLRNTPIRLIPPRPLDWKVKSSDGLKTVIDKLKAAPKKWFIPIVKDEGTLENVIHEEAIWRLVDAKSADKTPYDEIMNKKVSDVLDFLKANKLERLMGIYVSINLNKSAGEANELMNSKDVNLAIIVDETGKPTHFVDTGDVRRLLLQA